MLSVQAPVEVQVASGTVPGEVIAFWEMPAGTNTAAITDFAVEASRDSGQTWRRVEDGISPWPFASLTGLEPAQSYVFRVAAVADGVAGPWSAPSEAVSPPGSNSNTFVEFVHVGNPGNPRDVDNPQIDILPEIGSVAYEYRIGKYEVTIGQYVEFLNAVARESDPYGLWNPRMAVPSQGGNDQAGDEWISGIARFGAPGAYTYLAVGPAGDNETGQSQANRPISYVSWFDAARFANWMHNGRGAGSTETGAYTLNGRIEGDPVEKNLGARFSIPTESEWYKAAYYSPLLNSGSGGYYRFATQSNEDPGQTPGNLPNQANYSFALSGDGILAGNMLTDVGAFTASPSYYGTFDQNGNVHEWLDDVRSQRRVLAPEVGFRGGSFLNDASFLANDRREARDAGVEDAQVGFRLASAAPSSWFRTVIEDVGSVTLWYDAVGRLFANSSMITVDGASVNYHAFKAFGWEAVAADDINWFDTFFAEDNTLVWRHSSGHLHFWKLSDAWAYESSVGWLAPCSAEYFATEVDFGVDFNGDGVLGGTLISDCGVPLYIDDAGRLFACGFMINVNGSPVDYHAFKAAGWEAVAADVIDGVSSLAWRHSSGHLHFWRLTDTWRLASSESWVPPDSNEYYAVEVAWGCDFNEDGLIGRPNVIGNCDPHLGVTLAHDESGRLFADFAGTQRFTMITFNGGPVDYHAFKEAGWEALAVRRLPGDRRLIDPSHELVWRHSSGHLHFWGLWGEGQHVESYGWVPPDSDEYYSVEVVWGCDLNDDGVIGRPKPNVIIEECGEVTLAYVDDTGHLFVLEWSDWSPGFPGPIRWLQRFEITFGGAPVDYRAFKVAGWEAVAADVVDGVNSLAWRHSSGHLHFWRLSATWAWESSDSWVPPDSDEYYSVEVAWGCDLNEDGVIGRPPVA